MAPLDAPAAKSAKDAATEAGVLPIQFIDLKAQQAQIRDRVEARFSAILDHGRYIQGPEVIELEKTLAEFTGAADCVAVASGTDAIVMALMALGVTAGDAVFIPSFTYNATANAVLLTGAEPVFVDVDPATFNMDPVDLAKAVMRVKTHGRLKPKLVIAVDLYGLPADVPALEAASGGVPVIVDAAQSFGGTVDGQWVGAAAPITTTSFYPAKALGCYGDGGAIFTMDTAMAEVLRSIRWHGTCECKMESVRVGVNGRLDSLQCAVVLEKMTLFEAELERRRAIAAIYEAGLRGVVGVHGPRAGITSGYGLFTVTTPDRDGVRARLGEAGVPSAIYYKMPLHQMGAFHAYAPAGGLPVCERLADEVLSLPIHGYMTNAQAEYVVEQVKAAVG